MDICFNCGRPGHWAKDCDRQACRKCMAPMDLHTEAGIIECAWRGPACGGCGQPPHPDHAPGRCARYTQLYDTQADRDIRLRTPWHRDADPDTFYRSPRQSLNHA